MCGSPVRVALIGCGQIGPTHLAAIALDARARISVVCDLDPQRARQIAPQARWLGDWMAAVSDPEVDLVVVATPHHLHAEIACAALAAGKHIWVEKPLATTPADIARICAAAAASERIAAGVFQHRHSPLVHRLHALVAAGDFGAVEAVDLRFRCTRTDAYYASGAWRGRWEGEGGALLINQAIHHLDLALWFAGEPLSVAGAVERRRLASIACEDAARLAITCRGGAQVAVDVANDGITDWDGNLAVRGRDGGFTLDANDRLLTIAHPSQALVAEVRALTSADADDFALPGKADYGHSHARQAADIISAIRTGRRPAVTVADAAVANRVVLAAYHATATGAAVDLASFTGAGYRRPTLSLTPQGHP